MGLLQRLRGTDTSDEAPCPRCNLPTPVGTAECAACGWDTRESYHAVPGSTIVADEVAEPQ